MNHPRLLPWLIFAALSLIWGSSFILMKKALISFSPVELASSRIVISFILLFPLLLSRIRKIPASLWKYLLVAGIIGNGIPAFLFAYAQSGIDSATAGILNSLTPLFTLLAGIFFFKTPARWPHVTGVIIGLTGAVSLLMLHSSHGMLHSLSFGVWVILATILYAINANVLKKFLTGLDATSIASASFSIIGIPAAIYLITSTSFFEHLQYRPGAWESLLYISILSILGSGLSVIAYNKLIKITSAVFAASVTYIMPVIALAWGITDGETFSLAQLLCLFLIFTGIYLLNYKNNRIK